MHVLTLSGLLVLAAGQAPDPLARARHALGAWTSGTTALEGRGTARVSGAAGELRVLLGPGGLYLSEVRSALPEARGFDGVTAWARDRTGLARSVELEEADAARVFHAVLSGQWLDAPGLARTPAPDATRAGDEIVLALAETPLAMVLTLDAGTALPAELARSAGGERRRTFGDFRDVAGVRLPHRWTYLEGAGEDEYRVEGWRAGPLAPEAFAAELGRPRDVRFDPDVSAELAVTRSSSGKLAVEPLLEGELFGLFLLDTGAGITVVDRRVEDELMLETLGSSVAVGVAGSTTSSYRRGERFQLGPVLIADPVYGDLDLGFAQGEGTRRVAGILGYDLLARCVAELEPASARAALHDPVRFELTGARWEPLVLQHGIPCVRARYAARPGEIVEGLFRLDSGASGTLTFHAPAVDAHRLLEGRTLSEARSGGVGGTAPALAGELAWFELAGKRFERLTVELSRATAGSFTDPYTEGNVGIELLSAFRIVLDYGGRRIALVPPRVVTR